MSTITKDAKVSGKENFKSLTRIFVAWQDQAGCK